MTNRKGRALITGAARRIGRAIALDLAEHGWDVAIHYGQSEDAAAETRQACEAAGVNAVALAADLLDEEQVLPLVQRAVESIGPLDLLVNNASIFDHDTPATVTRESWDRHMEANLRAPFVLSQAFARQINPRRPGTIVNIIDQRVWRLTGDFTTYTLSKAGLWTLTQTLAIALAPTVRVNGIGPGPVLPSPRQSEAHFQTQVDQTLLARPAALSEIAASVRHIVASPSMTGQMIALDGGQHLTPGPVAGE